jgi:pimeloyl-ACP methyl ester carboxylesterase
MKIILKVLGYGLLTVLVALLVVPFLLPQSGSGTLDHRQSAGPDAVFVEINGLEVHVQHTPYTGADLNPPLLLLLHGFGANVHSWRDVTTALSAYGNVLAYDRPAFGWTQRSVDHLTVDPYTEQAGHEILTQLIQRYATETTPVILFGHSAGGGVATSYAINHSDSVNALVLIAPAVATYSEAAQGAALSEASDDGDGTAPPARTRLCEPRPARALGSCQMSHRAGPYWRGGGAMAQPGTSSPQPAVLAAG